MLFGFVWKNPASLSAIDRINGDKYYDKNTASRNDGGYGRNVTNYPTYESYAYPSSNHPGGVNVAFCGGNVRVHRRNDRADHLCSAHDFEQQEIEAQVARTNVPDRKLPQPSDDQY